MSSLSCSLARSLSCSSNLTDFFFPRVAYSFFRMKKPDWFGHLPGASTRTAFSHGYRTVVRYELNCAVGPSKRLRLSAPSPYQMSNEQYTMELDESDATPVFLIRLMQHIEAGQAILVKYVSFTRRLIVRKIRNGLTYFASFAREGSEVEPGGRLPAHLTLLIHLQNKRSV